MLKGKVPAPQPFAVTEAEAMLFPPVRSVEDVLTLAVLTTVVGVDTHASLATNVIVAVSPPGRLEIEIVRVLPAPPQTPPEDERHERYESCEGRTSVTTTFAAGASDLFFTRSVYLTSVPFDGGVAAVDDGAIVSATSGA